MDNAFTGIADWVKAQSLAESLRIQKLHRKLDEFASRFCPIYRDLASSYHWSVDRCEYATDIVFRKPGDLGPLYENLSRTATHAVMADNIATFLGKKLSPQFEGEMDNRFNLRIEGTRIKHTMASHRITPAGSPHGVPSSFPSACSAVSSAASSSPDSATPSIVVNFSSTAAWRTLRNHAPSPPGCACCSATTGLSTPSHHSVDRSMCRARRYLTATRRGS